MPMPADSSHAVWTPGEQVAFVEMPDEKMRKMPFQGAVAISNMFQFWKEVSASFRNLRVTAGSSAST